MRRPWVVDLCCGIGSDAAALSHHGQVMAVDRAPAMVLRSMWNAEVLGQPERFVAQCGDVTAEDWAGQTLPGSFSEGIGCSRGDLPSAA